MSTSRAYIVACAFSLVPMTGAGFVLGDVDLALRTVVAGLAVVLDLLLAEHVARRFVLSAAVPGSDDRAVGHLVLKLMALPPLAFVLLVQVGAPAVALAAGSLVLGALVHAAAVALRAADATFAVGASS